jgi:hypothetical protein
MSAAVWVSFFLPAALGGSLDLSLGAAVLLLGVAQTLSKASPWEARRPSALALKIFLALEILYAVSFAYSAAFNGIEVGLWHAFDALRYVVLGAFAVYVIRHYDAHVRNAMDWATAAALYASLCYPPLDPQGYVAVMALCWLLFFSRLRLRLLHAATAVLVAFFNGGPVAWAAAYWVLSTALAFRLYRRLHRKRVRYSARAGVTLLTVLLACPIVYIRSHPAVAVELRSSSETVVRQLIHRSPVFGWGPTAPDALPGRSQYLFWELKGGMPGAGLILAALVLVGYRLLRAAGEDAAHYAGAAGFLGGVAILLSGGRFLEGFRLFFLTGFFVAGMFEGRKGEQT